MKKRCIIKWVACVTLWGILFTACGAAAPQGALRHLVPVAAPSNYLRDDIPDQRKIVERKEPSPNKPRTITNQGVPHNTAKVLTAVAVNTDTVGWLRVGGTKINDAVVHTTTSKNMYYLKHNFNKEMDKDGTYFADYRATFGDGTRDGLARNTVIYGHSWDDNPNSGLFSQIKRYRDPGFAEKNPYLYFSAGTEDMAFEVFAVYDAHVNFPYVQIEPTQGYTVNSLHRAMARSSIYNYQGVEVLPTDKVLTLSTCTYTVKGKPYQPKDTDYRFVVVGRLVPRGESLKKSARFTINDSPYHPDTYSKVREVSSKK